MKMSVEFKKKQGELMAMQKQWLAEEVAALEARGQGGISSYWAAMRSTTARVNREVAKEREILGKKYGVGLAGQAAMMAEQVEGMDLEDAGVPMVKLGDASIAAPFTSKLPSIVDPSRPRTSMDPSSFCFKPEM